MPSSENAFDKLVGLTIWHKDGAAGSIISIARDGRLRVSFHDGVVTRQPVRDLFVKDMPLLEYLFRESIGLDRRLRDEELEDLWHVSTR